MGKNLLIIVTTIFAASFIKSEGQVVHHESKILGFVKNVFSAGDTNDICSCANYSCSCCLTNDNGKGCAYLNVMELTGRNGDLNYTLEILVKVEGSVILAEYFDISNDSIACYSFDDLGVCAKLVLTKQEDGVRICGFLQLSLNNRKVHEIKVYCLDVPSGDKKVNTAEERLRDLVALGLRGLHTNNDVDTKTERQKKKKKDKKEEHTERPPIVPPMPFIPFIPWSS